MMGRRRLLLHIIALRLYNLLLRHYYRALLRRLVLLLILTARSPLMYGHLTLSCQRGGGRLRRLILMCVML